MVAIDSYLRAVPEKYPALPGDSKSLEYFRFLLKSLIATRNARVHDFTSDEFAEAKKIAEAFFEIPLESFYLTLCIDGRVLSETVFGFSFGAFRTPAGDISDALLQEDGKLFLREGDFTKAILDGIQQFGKIVLVLDSHLGCAAKAEEQKQWYGKACEDGGLRADVERKSAIVEALFRFLEKRFGEEAREKFSFFKRPSTFIRGFLYAGLPQFLENSSPSTVLTEAVLERAGKKGAILSTELWTKEGRILGRLFREKLGRDMVPSLDFERWYASSIRALWKAIHSISEEALPLVEEEVRRRDRDADPLKIRVAARLFLSNAVLAFLLNRDGVYPFSLHRETVVVATNYARGPYSAATPFPILPGGNIAYVASFASGIVRMNRLSGRFPSAEEEIIAEIFGNDFDSLAKSPVLIFISERTSEIFSDDMLEKNFETFVGKMV
ncbi:MAG: hypothetical protein IPL87_03840 [Candidatus Moraniibacteriota bacterium]|nr:MAG: hypothetical protein IPL87_03840 [Candidatus Moranbacteria bacterium]